MPYSLKSLKSQGFTIVELLVVIVVIGILAAITIVAFNGVQTKAAVAVLKSDIGQSRTQLELYNLSGTSYPTSEADAKAALKLSSGTELEYTPRNSGQAYCVTVSSEKAKTSFHYDSADGVIADGPCAGHVGYVADGGGAPALDPADWIVVGTQTWARANLNVGTRIASASQQTDNSTIEKYCYSNNEANCTTYGGLYQWNEAMQYVTTEGAQGICPADSHIPTDADWKTLEMFLGMTQPQADTSGFRGTDQGTQLRTGGSSGLEMPLAGRRGNIGSFSGISSNAFLWSSSESSSNASNAWYRTLYSSDGSVSRGNTDKSFGSSVRCLGN